MTRTPRWLTVLAVLAVVVLLVGAGLYVWGIRSATFGWFAYTPLPTDAAPPQIGTALVLQRAGEVLVAVGLVAVGFVAGVLVGRQYVRRRARDGRESCRPGSRRVARSRGLAGQWPKHARPPGP